ncbi:MAG: DUF5615 family PIN-like protein [Thermoplasmatota archaeon]
MGRSRGGVIVRFLADENLPASFVEFLRRSGASVETVVEIGLQGAAARPSPKRRPHAAQRS